MQKKYLFTPGPTPVPMEVLLEMCHPTIHHRTPEFEKNMEQVRQGLKWLFQTEEEVLIFASSGTGAMESAVQNLFSAGDKAIYVNGGKFGERWGQIGRAFGLEMVEIKVPWGEAVKVDEIQTALKEHPDAKGLLMQACETSTGVAHPVREIGEILKDTSVLSVVDAITGIGVMDLPFDASHIDVMIGGSQKGLMLPPGLSFVAVSQKGWEAHSRSTLPRYYFDWTKTQKAQNKNSSAFTPATTLIQGLAKVLEGMQEEGREKIFKRHAVLAEATQKAIQAMGLSLFASAPAPGITAVHAPEGISSNKIISSLKTDFSITIANGQEEYKNRIFRIAHMGYFTPSDMLQVYSALEITLKKLGHPLEIGRGVAAGAEIFAQKWPVS
ncbi:MAG: alanine--glyoxylate aminotransferase family protein [Planctomycetota bacterium]|nr:MAG: alanine--glyoxylate aminotransferase family protein [Planctomycetota bacterium]